MKHTPGPWRIIVSKHKLTVGPVRMLAKKRMADARLIAAAPDMLERLERLISSPEYEIENLKALATEIINRARGKDDEL